MFLSLAVTTILLQFILYFLCFASPSLYVQLNCSIWFTLQWDKSYFPTPIEMQKNVSKHGRKMVTIVDPHMKRDDNYYIHKEASSKGLYVKNKDGGDFDGWCWPGQSSYLDFTSAKVSCQHHPLAL